MPEVPEAGVKVEEYEVLRVSDGDGTVEVRFNSPKEAVVTIQGTCKFSLMRKAIDKVVDKHPDIALG